MSSGKKIVVGVIFIFILTTLYYSVLSPRAIHPVESKNPLAKSKVVFYIRTEESLHNFYVYAWDKTRQNWYPGTAERAYKKDIPYEVNFELSNLAKNLNVVISGEDSNGFPFVCGSNLSTNVSLGISNIQCNKDVTYDYLWLSKGQERFPVKPNRIFELWLISNWPESKAYNHLKKSFIRFSEVLIAHSIKNQRFEEINWISSLGFTLQQIYISIISGKAISAKLAGDYFSKLHGSKSLFAKELFPVHKDPNDWISGNQLSLDYTQVVKAKKVTLQNLNEILVWSPILQLGQVFIKEDKKMRRASSNFTEINSGNKDFDFLHIMNNDGKINKLVIEIE